MLIKYVPIACGHLLNALELTLGSFASDFVDRGCRRRNYDYIFMANLFDPIKLFQNLKITMGQAY